ncbi:MAG: OadG family protein [bacterium]|nr:OadG family protein [bacterium]
MIGQSLVIAVVGMATVFLFLVLLVFTTQLTGYLVQKYLPAPAVTAPPKSSANPQVTTHPVPANVSEKDKIAAVIAIAEHEFGLSV